MNKDFRTDLEKVIDIMNFDRPVKELKFPVFGYEKFEGFDIYELSLSKRSENALRHNGIHHIVELIENWDDIGLFRGVGVGAIKEIKNSLLNFWYKSLTKKEIDAFWEKFVRINYRSVPEFLS